MKKKTTPKKRTTKTPQGKKRSETTVGDLKTLLTTKGKKTWPLMLGFYIALFIIFFVCLGLLSKVAMSIAPYQDVLLNSIKPAMINTGELSDVQAMQLIAFGEVLNGIIVKTVLIVLLFFFLHGILRLIRDYKLWQQLHKHKLVLVQLIKAGLGITIITVVGVFLLFFVLKLVTSAGLILTLWTIIYLCCETAYYFIIGSKLAKKRKRHAPHLLPLLFAAQALLLLATLVGLFILFIIIAILGVLPLWLHVIIGLLLIFAFFVKLTGFKLIITKRLYEREVQ